MTLKSIHYKIIKNINGQKAGYITVEHVTLAFLLLRFDIMKIILVVGE